MTESRAAGRLRVLPRVLASRVFPRRKPAQPKRVLIAHHLLTGDVVMLAPLLPSCASATRRRTSP